MTSTLDRPRIGVRTDRFREDEVRVDGTIKALGQAKYTADYSLPGMLWADFLPGTLAHAKIVSIDTNEARAMPGVHAVLTGRDIGDHYFGRRLCDWPVLAIDRVRFIGEFVAAVAAETPQIAEAAIASIVVDYEELPGLFDTEEALKPDALVLHEHPEKYPFMFPKRPQHPHPNIQGYGNTTIGDVAAGFAQSARIFEHTFTTPRYHGGYLEPRATMVWIDGDGIVHVISTNKSPFSLREQLAVTTGLPQEKFVVHPSYVGGDFGAKGLSVEEFPCYYLAAASGRPVKFVRNYLDDIRSTTVRHASKITVRTGVTPEGKVIAFHVNALFDGGAYAAGKVIPTILPGPETKFPYGIPNQSLERTAVYTNSVPGGFMRAPGDIQCVFAAESAIDLVARELGIEPLEFRMLNCAREGELDVEGHSYLAARGAEVLEVLKRESDWGSALPEGRGRGVAFAVRHIGVGKTSLKLIVHPTGDLVVQTGTVEQGMGIFTVLTRVVAVDLGIDLGRVRDRARRYGERSVRSGRGREPHDARHRRGGARRNAPVARGSRSRRTGEHDVGCRMCRAGRIARRRTGDVHGDVRRSAPSRRPAVQQLQRLRRRRNGRPRHGRLHDQRRDVLRRRRHGPQPGRASRPNRRRLRHGSRPLDDRGVDRGRRPDCEPDVRRLQAAVSERHAAVPRAHLGIRSGSRTVRRAGRRGGQHVGVRAGAGERGARRVRRAAHAIAGDGRTDLRGVTPRRGGLSPSVP